MCCLLATLRIRFLPSSTANIVRWEEQQQPLPPSVKTANAAASSVASSSSSMSSLNHLLGCMTLKEEVDQPALQSGAEAAGTRSHATWCAVQRPSVTAESLSALNCTCSDSVPLPCQIVVNAAWERLFGWSQEEVRRKVLRCGLRAQSQWYRLDSWYSYHLLLGQSRKDARGGTNFRTFAIIRRKSGQEISCVLHKKGVQKDGFTEGTLRYFPLQGGVQPHPD